MSCLSEHFNLFVLNSNCEMRKKNWRKDDIEYDFKLQRPRRQYRRCRRWQRMMRWSDEIMPEIKRDANMINNSSNQSILVMEIQRKAREWSVNWAKIVAICAKHLSNCTNLHAYKSKLVYIIKFYSRQTSADLSSGMSRQLACSQTRFTYGVEQKGFLSVSVRQYSALPFVQDGYVIDAKI